MNRIVVFQTRQASFIFQLFNNKVPILFILSILLKITLKNIRRRSLRSRLRRRSFPSCSSIPKNSSTRTSNSIRTNSSNRNRSRSCTSSSLPRLPAGFCETRRYSCRKPSRLRPTSRRRRPKEAADRRRQTSSAERRAARSTEYKPSAPRISNCRMRAAGDRDTPFRALSGAKILKALLRSTARRCTGSREK